MNPSRNSLAFYVPFISVILVVTGLSLMVFMITTESEPGLLPLVMTATGGLAWIVYKIKFKPLK